MAAAIYVDVGPKALQSCIWLPSLGLTTEQVDSKIAVAALVPDTPAYESGLSPGDVNTGAKSHTNPNSTHKIIIHSMMGSRIIWVLWGSKLELLQ